MKRDIEVVETLCDICGKEAQCLVVVDCVHLDEGIEICAECIQELEAARKRLLGDT